ncbi:exonuclease SbcCD subunit D [Paenibacillus sp. 28ISP30-2]|uniref:exonuclease SbcCD subunit D n=1 Tax=Paenibacillus sp. 23TSA30-6 TaxID=2546104 RepID=UPI0017888640|nr:exonuclease SbcCD subunit D [Paenibacillus sp. 23TSA30-6]MBE0339639.1 exonuclease SbcCD subunit D [Paenibacillus sp. 23TSA30-6]MBE0341616.1 exonuclease SbcCD subunit D [Paenibacillus sp. 28ISP30-2]
MRILHTGDWHLGRTLEGRSRLKEQEAFLEELAKMADDQQADLIMMAGDVYDSVNPPAAAEQLFYETSARLTTGGRPLVVIAGNHDQPERVSSVTPLVSQRGITLLGLPSGEAVRIRTPRTGEMACIAALPYPSESRLNELLSEDGDETVLREAYSRRVGMLMTQLGTAFRPDTVNLSMSHIYVLGGLESDSERPIQVGGAYTVDPSALSIGAQYTALGHLHRPQYVKGDGLMRYSGSPLAYSFSEAGQAKSVTLIDVVAGKPAQVEELYITSGRPLVKWRARGGLEEVYRWLDEGLDADAFIDLEITLEEAMSLGDIQRLRKSREGIIHIRPMYPEMAAAQLEHQRSELPVHELFRAFYQRQTGGAQPDDGLVQLFLELVEQDDARDQPEEEDV